MQELKSDFFKKIIVRETLKVLLNHSIIQLLVYKIPSPKKLFSPIKNNFKSSMDIILYLRENPILLSLFYKNDLDDNIENNYIHIFIIKSTYIFWDTLHVVIVWLFTNQTHSISIL